MRVDTGHSTYRAGWHVWIHYWRNWHHETIEAGTRTRAALGAGSTVFDLHAPGKYFLRAMVFEPGGLINGSCFRDVYVGGETRDVATVRLFGKDRDCRWTLSRRSRS